MVDYFGEGPIPMLMQLIPVAYFNLSAVAVIHGVSSYFLYDLVLLPIQVDILFSAC